VKPFVFTKIKSIADRSLANVTPSVSAPLCSTAPVFVQFSQIKYRKTGSTNSADDYGNSFPVYEYELPAGWQITSGYVGQGSTSSLVLGTNNVGIQPSAITTGTIKVRPINAECGDLYKQGQWSTVAIQRPSLTLKSGGLTSFQINCSDVTPRTFTVENGNLANCATFTFSTASGWLDANGQPFTGITTANPSITLTPVSTLANPPQPVSVTVSSGGYSVPSTVGIQFTNNKPGLDLLVPAHVCIEETAELKNIPQGANVTWTASKSGVVQFTPMNPSGSLVKITKITDDQITITATLNTTGCGSFPYSQNATVGVGLAPVITNLNFDRRCGTFMEAYSDYPQGATGHIWNLNFGQVVQNSDGYGSDYFYVSPLINNPQSGLSYYHYVSVQAKNICGASAPSATRAFTVGPVPSTCGSGGGTCGSGCSSCCPILLIAPNPVSSTMSVETTDGSLFTSMRIIDKMGSMKKQLSIAPAKRATVNVQDLPSDIYRIQVFNGKTWLTGNFVKQ
jgi:hypothetical protein